MKLKGWMLRKVNGMGNPGSRVEPRSHAAMAAGGAGAPQFDASRLRAFGEHRGAMPDDVENLGPYRALIGAIREELEHFVTTQLRLHLAIAERGCARIRRNQATKATSIASCCAGSSRRRLSRSSYLAKEVIAALRNASAIDLSPAGLNAAQQDRAQTRKGAIWEHSSSCDELASKRRAVSSDPTGRWSARDTCACERPRLPGSKRADAACRADVRDDIEDAGAFAVSSSRPSCRAVVMPSARERAAKSWSMGPCQPPALQMWLEKGWWVVDAGSTNGIRVESVKAWLRDVTRRWRSARRRSSTRRVAGPPSIQRRAAVPVVAASVEVPPPLKPERLHRRR